MCGMASGVDEDEDVDGWSGDEGGDLDANMESEAVDCIAIAKVNNVHAFIVDL
jgi:hypothetical protein